MKCSLNHFGHWDKNVFYIILYYTQTFVLSSIHCTLNPPPKDYTAARSSSSYLCRERLFICDLNTLAGDHLNALQELLSSVWCVHTCFYSLLAEEMKYSWWRGGIGCWAKSVLTGLS